MLTRKDKDTIKKQLADSLSSEEEVQKIVVFGAFLESNEPNDLDVAVFQNSNESYLPLAVKYRNMTYSLARKLPIDIFPIRPNPEPTSFLAEIEQGEIIYERCNHSRTG